MRCSLTCHVFVVGGGVVERLVLQLVTSSCLVAGDSTKDNEDRDRSCTVPPTGWDLTGVPGQEPVECGRESQTVSPRRHK